jgi:hypothetical protein
MSLKCAAEACTDAAVASLEDRSFCRAHFLARAYRHLESIASQIQDAHFHVEHGESAARFLEQCMRQTADVACGAEVPGNLERAQVLDILLWASELHGRLRRGPRVRARIPILVRSENPMKPWEEKTETRFLSLHGFHFECRHEVQAGGILTCVRLDNGRRVEARVVWARIKDSGATEAGLQFLTDEDFWNLDGGAAAPGLSEDLTR